MTTDATSVARTQPALPAAARLSDRVLFRISGPGTDDFLQGQMSQNLTDVIPGYSPRAAASTPKGRAYLLTRLDSDGDAILQTLPAATADDASRPPNKALMLFPGTTMERLDSGQVLGLLGEESARTLLEDTTLPTEPGGTLALGEGHLIRTQPTAEGLPRFEFWLPSTADPSVQAKLERLGTATLADWNASDIAAGVAELDAGTREKWVPQMLNWQHLDGIHFKKGCYTGQEVIARMHFLVQLKKSVYRLSAPGGDTPSPGSSIVADGKPVGEVVRSVSLDDGSVQLLAVIKHASADAPLHLEATGQPLTIQPLPYAVPEREQPAEQTPDT